MIQTEAPLAVLQQNDRLPPSGGFTFSWRLEGLLADGRVPSPMDQTTRMDEPA